MVESFFFTTCEILVSSLKSNMPPLIFLLRVLRGIPEEIANWFWLRLSSFRICFITDPSATDES